MTFEEKIESFELKVGDTFQVNAPTLNDEDFNDSFQYKILKDSFDFVSSSGNNDIIYINPVLESDVGKYKLGF